MKLTQQNRQRLQALQSRAQHLTLFGAAPDGRSWNDTIAENIDRTLKASETELAETAKRLGKLYRKAHGGDEEAQHELRGLLIERTQNFVLPSSNFARFYDLRTCGPDQNPAIKNETRQEIRAKYIGERGQSEVTKILYPNERATVDWHVLESEEAEYETFDLYEGDISDVARAQFDIDFDLNQALEAKLGPGTGGLMASGVFGSFALTGGKASRVYNKHSRIRSDVLPTTNELAIPSISGSTKLGQTTLEAIVNYCACFTKTTPDGDLMPTGEIIVPADELIQVVNGITVTNAAQNAVAQQILQRGFYQLPEMLGVNWRLTPDNTIAKGYCYPILNKPVGILFRKPSADQMEEEILRRKRTARRWQNMVIASAIPTPNLKNIIRVRYHT